jgi:4,5-DOPA dioxygenase extradiol
MNKTSSNHKMPALFLGHGSPLYVIEEYPFEKSWQLIAKNLPEPRAILSISAHWGTRGTFDTGMEHPRTVHDFRNFPQALFDIQYPAKGDPKLANRYIDAWSHGFLKHKYTYN